MVDLNTKWNDYSSDTLYLWNGNTLFVIAEGTGDNLLDEDIEEGYKDYWLTEFYSENDGNGGQWMETELISDIDYTVQGVLDRMMECDLWQDNWKIINEDLGEDLRRCYEQYWFAKNELKRNKERINK